MRRKEGRGDEGGGGGRKGRREWKGRKKTDMRKKGGRELMREGEIEQERLERQESERRKR